MKTFNLVNVLLNPRTSEKMSFVIKKLLEQKTFEKKLLSRISLSF